MSIQINYPNGWWDIWEIKQDIIDLQQNKADKIFNNLSSNTDPNPNNDISQWYEPLSIWFNNFTDEIFKCMDNTLGNAVWVKTSLTLDELWSMALADTNNYYTKATLDNDFYDKTEVNNLLKNVWLNLFTLNETVVINSITYVQSCLTRDDSRYNLTTTSELTTDPISTTLNWIWAVSDENVFNSLPETTITIHLFAKKSNVNADVNVQFNYYKLSNTWVTTLIWTSSIATINSTTTKEYSLDVVLSPTIFNTTDRLLRIPTYTKIWWWVDPTITVSVEWPSNYTFITIPVSTQNISVSHNDTTDKQWGTIWEYYHLTQAQVNNLNNQSWVNSWDNAPNNNTWLVHTTWDETIWWSKTFTGNIISWDTTSWTWKYLNIWSPNSTSNQIDSYTNWVWYRDLILNGWCLRLQNWNVWIWVDNPSQKLEVNGDIKSKWENLLWNNDRNCWYTVSQPNLNHRHSYFNAELTNNNIWIEMAQKSNIYSRWLQNWYSKGLTWFWQWRLYIQNNTANSNWEIVFWTWWNPSTWRLVIKYNWNTTPFWDNIYSLWDNTNRWSSVWAANWTIQTSDKRTKTDITESKLWLDFINKLNPVSYKWINWWNKISYEEVEVEKEVQEEIEIKYIEKVIELVDGKYIEKEVEKTRTELLFDIVDLFNEKWEVIGKHKIPKMTKKLVKERKEIIENISWKRNHFWFIAQEVEEALAWTDFWWLVIDENWQYALRYDQFISPLVAAVKELKARVEYLENNQK